MSIELPGNRVLIVGAGSGRDISAAVYLRSTLASKVRQVDIAGFLTPWAWHRFGSRWEEPVNQLLDAPSKHLPTASGMTEAPCFEAHLPAALTRRGVEIDAIYLFSLQHGSQLLLQGLQRLVAERGYDAVVAVDVGGDILGRLDDYPTILTPLVDFLCLDALAGLPRSVRKTLAVMAPGVCGEVSGARLSATLATLSHAEALLDCKRYSYEQPAFRMYVDLNRALDRHALAPSHTAEVIARLANSSEPQEDYRATYVRNHTVADRTWRLEFPVWIPREHFNRIYFFDLCRVHRALARPTFGFRSLLEAFGKFRNAGLCGTELDGSSVVARGLPANNSQPLYLASPCDLASGDTRRQIIEYTATAVLSGAIHAAVLLERDAEALRRRSEFRLDMLPHSLCLLRPRTKLDSELQVWPAVAEGEPHDANLPDQEQN